MKKNGMFKELVFYVEACDSGSMFPKIKEKDNIFVMTSTSSNKDSWAVYCDEEAKVDGKKIGACLGDQFSINWMLDTEASDPCVETLAN